MEMDNIDMIEWLMHKSRYYRIPKKIQQLHMNNPLVKELSIISCGYREGHDKHIGYHVKKNANKEFMIKYCIHGKGWYEVNHKRYDIHPGDFIICKNWTAHSYGAEEEQPWSVYWIYFEGTLSSVYLDLLQGMHSSPVFHFGIDPKVEAYFIEILQEVEKGYAIQYHAHVSNIFRTLLSYINIKAETQVVNKKIRLEEIILYMNKMIDHTITLDDMAKQFNLSKDYFSKLFKKQYGFTPIDYFINLKMQKACQMITTSDLPLLHIAQQLGYTDYYYFSRLFKSKVGMSPRDYMLRFMNQ